MIIIQISPVSNNIILKTQFQELFILKSFNATSLYN